MIDRFLSHEEYGASGAKQKAARLRDENGYKILAIEHTQVPMAGSTSTPYSPTWGKTELGYRIRVDTAGYSENEDRSLPDIVEC